MGALTEQVKQLPEVQKEFEDELVSLNTNAHDLLEQANRAVVNTNDLYARGGDLVSAIRGQEQKSEELRKSVTGPIGKLVNLINAGFKPGKEIRGAARTIIETKMLVWTRGEEARLRKEAEEAARKLEEEALERAAIAGDEQSADEVLDAAADAAEVRREDTSLGIQRGEYGSSTSTKKVPVAEITDITLFLRSVDRWRSTVHPGSIIDFKKSGLNALAKAMIDNGLEIPGVTASTKDALNIR